MIPLPPENPKIENESGFNNALHSTDYNQISSVQMPAILVMCYAIPARIAGYVFFDKTTPKSRSPAHTRARFLKLM